MSGGHGGIYRVPDPTRTGSSGSCFSEPPEDHSRMKIEIEIPEKYARKLEEIEAVEPTIEEQIEVEVLPQVLRLINDAHRQLQEREGGRLVDPDEPED